jgi:predicted transcriptional regulator YdeE
MTANIKQTIPAPRILIKIIDSAETSRAANLVKGAVRLNINTQNKAARIFILLVYRFSPEKIVKLIMNRKIKQDGFSVVGFEARTNNATEMGPNGIIPLLWGRFLKENVISSTIIAGYTDYQSNKDGDYTFFIGTKVSSTDNVPSGMVVKHIPRGNYALLTTTSGPVWEVVQSLWSKIWNAPDSDFWSESNRSYQFDYEVYDERAKDQTNAQVDIYLGIK